MHEYNAKMAKMMDDNTKMRECKIYFNRLAHELRPYGFVVKKSGRDMYLCLDGSQAQISYKKKPCFSFRLSDHWNWIALDRNPDPNYIQCFNADLVGNRLFPSSEPMRYTCVAVTYNGRIYKTVFGDMLDDIGNTIWLPAGYAVAVADLKAKVLAQALTAIGKKIRMDYCGLYVDGEYYNMMLDNEYYDILNYLTIKKGA